jgi:superfamily I DNA and/or RNA helicase
MGDGLDDVTARLLPSLWSTLFLVVPVISTTFASVGRMLGQMPPQSLGWLLIDEAGQATPQAAVGAIMRARGAIVVGDPLQIEPVVTLPLSLVERLALRMSVDPATWAAPKASAQTLADSACQYQSWIEQVEGAVRVGVPLLVHRRCAEPMFGISNTVAYAGKMVQAKPATTSRVRDALGPSRWFHVSDIGSGKWCPAEGQIIEGALRTLVSQGLSDPDVFVITPFRIVARQMREQLAASDVVRSIADRPWEWVRDRVGTIHTFQGREAEAVFLVLGAPDASQTGARNWAGYPPNLANVAVSRAKEVLYVVGNRELWSTHGSFRAVNDSLPT